MKVFIKKITMLLLILAMLSGLNIKGYAEDSEGWRRTLYTAGIESQYGFISIDIKKNEARSYALEYRARLEDGSDVSLACIRLSESGKLLLRGNGRWIGKEEEENELLIKADFKAGTVYRLKMQHNMETGVIEWFLDGEKIGESTTSYNKYCSLIRLMTTTADMNYVDWSLEKIIEGDKTSFEYFSKYGGQYEKLSFDENEKAYVADDGVSLIGDTKIMPSDEYSVGIRAIIGKKGRKRIFGEISQQHNGLILTAAKNNEIVWKQLFPKGESGIFDVRALANEGDKLDIEMSVYGDETDEAIDWSWSIEPCVGTLVCEASTSSGYSYEVIEEIMLTDLLSDTTNENISYCSRRFSRELPMTYNGEKWVSSISGDTGYFSGNTAYPGRQYDSVMKIITEKSGLLRIDGEMLVNQLSDGVVCRILHNGKVVWSSRVGGERPVRWDEPYDTSYFLYDTGIVLNTQAGDQIEFVFDQWRLVDNDAVDLSDISLKYIDGEVISETTKWKISESALLDAYNNTVLRNGIEENIDVIFKGDAAYVTVNDAEKLFGAIGAFSQAVVTHNGKAYVLINGLAEELNKSVVWANEDVALIYDGIPVRFGWQEISEIAVAYEKENENIKGFCDTYEDDAVTHININGGNSDPKWENVGGLKPQNGHTEIIEQSDAVLLEYAQGQSILGNTSVLDISDYIVADKLNNVVSFDVFVSSPEDFVFSVADGEQNERIQVLISENGWLGPYYANGGYSKTKEQLDKALADTGLGGAEFIFGKWNNIKLIINEKYKVYHLYLNNTLVKTVSESVLSGVGIGWNGAGMEKLKITNYANEDEKPIPLYLDNIVIGQPDTFLPSKTLNDSFIEKMNVTLNEGFEGQKKAFPLSENTENQLRPTAGFAKYVGQSNSAIIYSGTEVVGAEHIRFDVRDYVGDGTRPAAVELDVNVFDETALVFSVRNYWGVSCQMMVSPNGYALSDYGKWLDADEQQASVRAFLNEEKEQHISSGRDVVDFEKNNWHKIKIIYMDAGTKYLLYLDGKLISDGIRSTQKPFEAFQITMLTHENTKISDAVFAIDNIKVGVVDKLKINKFYTEDMNGNRVEKFACGNEYRIRLEILNENTFEQSARIVVAQYDENGKLNEASISESISVGEGESYNSDVSDNISFTPLENTKRIEVFLWDSLGRMIPLSDSLQLELISG